ncbi:MAG TPA: hypothetical protein VEV85_07015 [Bryobacteraceae bacterium]|nr:hypothetical protein [Bryobacteraceae bacterium]
MSGEILIQVIDIVRFQTIRPALSELEAVRMLGSEARIVLREATASPFARGIRYGHFAGLLSRILSHLELELRVFLTSRDVDEVIHGLVRVLCFENGAKFSLVEAVGPNWVVLESSLSTFIHLNWFRQIFLEGGSESALAYPQHGEVRYYVLRREDVAHLAAGLRPLLEEPALAPEAEGLARLAARALSAENLTLAHTCLL